MAHFIWLVVRTVSFFFTFEQPKQYKLWSCQKIWDALPYLLDNIFIRFGSKLYRQNVGIPWVLIVLLLLQISFCFVMRETSCCLCQTEIIEAFNSTFRYLDDLHNIDNPYFEHMISQIYPTKLYRRMAENGFAPTPREFCRHILSCRELKAESFKKCLHSVLRGVSL